MNISVVLLFLFVTVTKRPGVPKELVFDTALGHLAYRGNIYREKLYLVLKFSDVSKGIHPKKTRPEGLLDPKIRDEMSDFLEIFPTENQI